MPQSFDYRKMNRHLSEVHVPHLLRQKYSKKIYIYIYIRFCPYTILFALRLSPNFTLAWNHLHHFTTAGLFCSFYCSSSSQKRKQAFWPYLKTSLYLPALKNLSKKTIRWSENEIMLTYSLNWKANQSTIRQCYNQVFYSLWGVSFFFKPKQYYGSYTQEWWS